MSEEKIEWTVLGRAVGHASGWDQVDTLVILLYDFVPYPGIALPTGDVNFDFEHGWAELFDDVGNVVEKVDLVEALAVVPR